MNSALLWACSLLSVTISSPPCTDLCVGCLYGVVAIYLSVIRYKPLLFFVEPIKHLFAKPPPAGLDGHLRGKSDSGDEILADLRDSTTEGKMEGPVCVHCCLFVNPDEDVHAE